MFARKKSKTMAPRRARYELRAPLIVFVGCFWTLEAQAAEDLPAASARVPAEHESSEARDPDTAASPDGSEGSRAARQERSPAESKDAAPEPGAGEAIDPDGHPLVAAHFRASHDDVRFLLGPPPSDVKSQGFVPHENVLGTDQLRALCVAPCARWLYPGVYSVALSRGGDPVRTLTPLTLDAPSLVEGEYRSYTWMRVAGYVTLGASVVLGSLFVLSSVDDCGTTDGTCLQREANVFIGVGVMLVGLTGGLLMTQKDDEARVVTRGAPPGLAEPR